MKKTIISLLMLVLSHNALAWHGTLIMMNTPTYSDTSTTAKNEIGSTDSYFKFILTIQEALKEYNNLPYVPGDKPIIFYDLERANVLSFSANVLKNTDTVKIDNISVTIKTNEKRKLDLLVQNASKDQCGVLIHSFLSKPFRSISLNKKPVGGKTDFVCSENNSIEVKNI